MNREDKKNMLEFLNGEINPGLLPAGATTIQRMQDWTLGYMACTVKITEWAEKQEEKEKKTRPEQWTEKEMSGEEDRDQIVRILQELIQHTRTGAGLVALRRIPAEYPIKGETVEAVFINGSKKSHSIHGDSGIAIIRDVLKMFG